MPLMPFLTRSLLLPLLTKHYRLTADLANPGLTGLPPDGRSASFLLHQLLISGKIFARDGGHTVTYTLANSVMY